MRHRSFGAGAAGYIASPEWRNTHCDDLGDFRQVPRLLVTVVGAPELSRSSSSSRAFPRKLLEMVLSQTLPFPGTVCAVFVFLSP